MDKDENFENFYMRTIQSKENLKKCRQFINDLYVTNGLEKTKFLERTIFKITNGIYNYKEIHFFADETISLKYENLINSLNNKFDQSNWKNHELLRYFKPECVIQEGQKLESLPDLEKLNGDKAVRSYLIEEGKISIIYMWTIFKSICKTQLRLLNELFDVNHNWDGNVKVISINTDLNRDYAKKFIKSLDLNHIEHLYIDSIKHPIHPLFKLSNKYGYPVCILINKENVIDICGSLYDIHLQTKINDMINRNLETNKCGANYGKINEIYYKNVKLFLKRFDINFDSIKNLIKVPHLCSALLVYKKIYTTDSNHNFNYEKNPIISNISQPNVSTISSKKGFQIFKSEKSNLALKKLIATAALSKTVEKVIQDKPNYEIYCELNYFCHSDDQLKFDSLFSDVYGKITINKNIIETFEISYAEPKALCSNCKLHKFYNANQSSINLCESDLSNSTPNGVQYYCDTCKYHFCKDCGEIITNLNFPDKIHNHHLYYLTENNKYYMKYILLYNHENSYEFDFKYFQENKKSNKFINDIKFHYQVKCDGCLAFPIKCIRWKCCNCVFKNICELCKNNVDNKVSPYYESIIYNLDVSKCDPINHVFMKIIFDSFVY